MLYHVTFAFTSDAAKKLNQEIFETLYFAAALLWNWPKKKVHSSFEGSPMSQGEFQFVGNER
jgi:ribonucleoside-diphosphate reductase alpha chain